LKAEDLKIGENYIYIGSQQVWVMQYKGYWNGTSTHASFRDVTGLLHFESFIIPRISIPTCIFEFSSHLFEFAKLFVEE